jgi:hypothetical protein
LLLFGATVLAVAVTFAVVIWLIARKGRVPKNDKARV